MKRFISKLFHEKKLSEIVNELRWIYEYGRKYRRNLLWFVCLGVVGTVFGLLGSIISKRIIDAVTGFDAATLIMAVVFYAFFQIFNLGLSALNQRVSAKIEIKVDQEIRADIYGNIMDADWEALSEFHSGDLINRADSDVSNVASSVIGWIPELITHMFRFFGTFAVMIYYDAVLAVLALLSAPVFLLVSRTLTKRMRDYREQMCKMNSETMIFEEESFQNVQLIKSFNVGGFYREKLAQIHKKRRTIKLAYLNFTIVSGICMSILGMLVTGVCFGWGIYRLWIGQISLGTMLLFLQLAGGMRGAFSSLIYMIPKAISAATSAGRLMEIANLPKESCQSEEDAQTLIKQNNGVWLRAENITFRYKNGKEVIANSDFIANPGEIIGVVGPSGGGKTTLFRILLGMVSVCDGSVEIGETNGDCCVPVSASTRGLFSYVPQNNFMFFDTIAENMRMVNKNATDDEIADALKQACAYEFIQSLPDGLYSKIGEKGCGFSEGQIQRLAIARALISKAPIILLDEATSALDAETEQKILHNVLEKNQHRILIFATHRPSVLPMCNRVYRIENKILKTVSLEEASGSFANNRYECNN